MTYKGRRYVPAINEKIKSEESSLSKGKYLVNNGLIQNKDGRRAKRLTRDKRKDKREMYLGYCTEKLHPLNLFITQRATKKEKEKEDIRKEKDKGESKTEVCTLVTAQRKHYFFLPFFSIYLSLP